MEHIGFTRLMERIKLIKFNIVMLERQMIMWHNLSIRLELIKLIRLMRIIPIKLELVRLIRLRLIIIRLIIIRLIRPKSCVERCRS